MSAGGQGQGKNLCCFQAPLKSMRRVLAAPGSSPSLPGPHAGPERSRNTRRVPVMYTERTTARRRPWVPRGKRRASLTISTHGELLTGSTSTAGPQGLAGPQAPEWTARNSPGAGASPRAFAERSAAAGSPHRYSRPAELEALSRDSKGTARELVLHGEPGPYRAVR